MKQLLYGLLGFSSFSLQAALLETLTWQEAEKILTPQTIVVIPIGAAAKEHGPHLKLNNDYLIASYFKDRIKEEPSVVVAPILNYHYYPSFAEYPGSTTLQLETARDVVIEICESFLRHGPRRFYALNTGVSTVKALKPAAEKLRAQGALLHFTDLSVLEPIVKTFEQQQGGTHADEIETSLMLFVAPDSVDMRKAVKDHRLHKGSLLTRNAKGEGTYSPTGTWGDPTLATREKGERYATALLEVIRKDLATLAKAKLP